MRTRISVNPGNDETNGKIRSFGSFFSCFIGISKSVLDGLKTKSVKINVLEETKQK